MQLQGMMLLYAYNAWAMQRILAATAQVSLAQFLAPSAHSYGGLRDILVHLLDTEVGWRMLCQQGAKASELAAIDFPMPALLAQRWRDEEAAMRAYLATLHDADLVGLIRYTTGEGERRERVLWHCLLHVVNHGTQHRSEAAILLSAYAQSPGDLDFTVFLNEQR